MATQTDVRSPLHETVATTPTDYWNDSCSIEELSYAIANGAVGAVGWKAAAFGFTGATTGAR